MVLLSKDAFYQKYFNNDSACQKTVSKSNTMFALPLRYIFLKFHTKVTPYK